MVALTTLQLSWLAPRGRGHALHHAPHQHQLSFAEKIIFAYNGIRHNPSERIKIFRKYVLLGKDEHSGEVSGRDCQELQSGNLSTPLQAALES